MRGIICAKNGLGKAHYIDSFAGMMSSLRKIAGKTNIPSSPRDQSIHWPKTTDRFWKNLWYGSILKGYAMMTSQFRSGRGKTKKREISRDFSRFFDPAFFRSFIDPFCPFRCCVRTRTHEKGFFASSQKQSVLWLDSDLRKPLAEKAFYGADNE